MPGKNVCYWIAGMLFVYPLMIVSGAIAGPTQKQPAKAAKPNTTAQPSSSPAQASAAKAQPREARIFVNDEQHHVHGDTVPAAKLHTILFIDEPCSLGIVGAENMRRAWAAYGAFQIGCWYPTIDGVYVFVGQIAALSHVGTYWESLPRAVINPDGSVLITEPGYDSKTFLPNFMNRRTQQLLEQMQQRQDP